MNACSELVHPVMKCYSMPRDPIYHPAQICLSVNHCHAFNADYVLFCVEQSVWVWFSIHTRMNDHECKVRIQAPRYVWSSGQAQSSADKSACNKDVVRKPLSANHETSHNTRFAGWNLLISTWHHGGFRRCQCLSLSESEHGGAI